VGKLPGVNLNLDWFIKEVRKEFPKIMKFVTNKIYITPSKLRESFQKRSTETGILLKILNFKPGNQSRINEPEQLETNPHRLVASLTNKKSNKSKELADATTFNQIPNKKGLWRKHVLCNYVTNNGRTVVTAAESECPYGECRIPSEFSHLVTEDFYDRRLNQTVKYVYDTTTERFVKYEGDELSQGQRIYRGIIDGDILVLNRQPTLHWRSLMSHKLRLSSEDLTIRLHRCCTSAYAADFDGDEVNVHEPISIRANLEARLLLNSRMALFDSGRVYVGPLFHELGVLRIISEKFPERVKEFLPPTFCYEDRGIKIVDGELISGLLGVDNIGMKSGSAFHKLQYYGELAMSEILTKICQVCDEVMSENLLTLTPEFLIQMIQSGCRGSADNLKFMNDRLGTQYLGGNEIELNERYPIIQANKPLTAIDSCYRNGLTPEEVVLQSLPTRKSLVDAKLNIATAGAMMNRLVSILSGTSVDSQANICYLGTIISSGQSISYKYYSKEYQTYIDLDQMMLDLVGRDRYANIRKPSKVRVVPFVMEPEPLMEVDLDATFEILESHTNVMVSSDTYGTTGIH
jgi:hypothetical protein